MTSIREALEMARLPGESGRLDAELLLCHCIGEDRSYLYTWPERELSADQLANFERLSGSRREGRPLAYLTGEREFWSLSLTVNEHTLIPRPETETLVEWALELPLEGAAEVADWGTGSGAIALALAQERPGWQVLACDSSAGALAVAAENTRRLGLGNVTLVLSDWGSAFGSRCFDLVASNPPYVAPGDPHLEEGDLRFEPESALVGGGDGLEDIRLIAGASAQCLRSDGWLLLEHGFDQADSVRSILIQAGFADVETRADLSGQDRISGGRWP